MGVCARTWRALSYRGLFSKQLGTCPPQGQDVPEREEIDRLADGVVRGKDQAMRLGTAPSRSARLGSARLGSARLGSARLGSARLGSARLGSARLGSARLGSARLGSARLGSARLGSARLGNCNGRFGPACQDLRRIFFQAPSAELCKAHDLPHVTQQTHVPALFSGSLDQASSSRTRIAMFSATTKPSTHLIAPTSARSPA